MIDVTGPVGRLYKLFKGLLDRFRGLVGISSVHGDNRMQNTRQ